MSNVTLVWIGDLNEDKHKMSNYSSVPDERYRPQRIELKVNQKEIRIGRINTKIPPEYPIESCINNRMISRNHATIERSAKGGFMLYDHSMNGTYVNYQRVIGGTTLKNGDIICFGHLNGANLKPGEKVSPFFSDLKYRVEIGAQLSDSVGKRRRRPSQADSTNSSNESDDLEDSDDSNKKSKSKKLKKSRDSDDETKNRKSVNGGRKSNVGHPSVKKTSTNMSSSKVGITSSSKPLKDKKIKKEKGDQSEQAVGGGGGGGGGTYEIEECSARPCKKPQDAAIDWIQCDKCTKWYHQVCIGCTPSEADVAVYHCPYCRR